MSQNVDMADIVCRSVRVAVVLICLTAEMIDPRLSYADSLSAPETVSQSQFVASPTAEHDASQDSGLGGDWTQIDPEKSSMPAAGLSTVNPGGSSTSVSIGGPIPTNEVNESNSAPAVMNQALSDPLATSSSNQNPAGVKGMSGADQWIAVGTVAPPSHPKKPDAGSVNQDVGARTEDAGQVAIVGPEPVENSFDSAWTLEAGQPIGRSLKAWGVRAGWTVRWALPKDIICPTTTTLHSNFKDAVGTVIKSLASNGALIFAHYYDGNQTVLVYGPGTNLH